MVDVFDAILDDITDNVIRIPTAFKSIDDMLDGGVPVGRLVELYGSSTIGKSSLALRLIPDMQTVYFDLERKLANQYFERTNLQRDHIIVNQSMVGDDSIFDVVDKLVLEDIVIIIDSIPMLGPHIEHDGNRSTWLSYRFARLQRILTHTKSIVILINQIRVNPSTGTVYNPLNWCYNPAIKLKMHYAEKIGDAKVVYLDVEKCFWGTEGARTTLKVSKLDITENRRKYARR